MTESGRRRRVEAIGIQNPKCSARDARKRAALSYTRLNAGSSASVGRVTSNVAPVFMNARSRTWLAKLDVRYSVVIESITVDSRCSSLPTVSLQAARSSYTCEGPGRGRFGSVATSHSQAARICAAVTMLRVGDADGGKRSGVIQPLMSTGQYLAGFSSRESLFRAPPPRRPRFR